MVTKKGQRQEFWHQLWSAWWERFPWKLEDDQEPPSDPKEMKRLASVEPGEQNLKETVEKQLAEVS